MSSSAEYLQRRLEPQERWHDGRARCNKWLFYTVEMLTLLAGAAIPVVNLWATKNAYLAALLSTVCGGVVVVAASVGKLFKFHDNWLQYRTVAETLAREKELFLNGSADYAKLDSARRERLLVQRVEDLLLAKTSQFVATHRDKPDGAEHASE